MNNSVNDAAYRGVLGSAQADIGGITINIESDDNDSTTAENEQLLPAVSATSGQQQQIATATPPTTTMPTSTSIPFETPVTRGGNNGGGASSRHGSSNLISSLLSRQRSYTPSNSGGGGTPVVLARSSTAQINRRLQPSRSVGSGNSSIDDSAPVSNSAAAATTGNGRQMGIWRVNLSNVLSLSTAPSTEALRSLFTHSNFRYQPPAGSGGVTAGATAGAASNENADNLLNSQDTNGATTSASLRFGNRSMHNGMGRSVSLREGEMQQAQGMSVRHNASVPTSLPEMNPPAYDDNVPTGNNASQMRATIGGGGGGEGLAPAAGGGSGNPQPPHEHNVDDEQVISDLVVHILSHFVRYLPVICILLVKFIYDHLLGILDLVVLLAIMYNVNKSLRTQVSRLAQKNFAVLMRDACFLVLVVALHLFLATTPPDPFGLIVPPPKISYTEVIPLPYKVVETSSITPDTLLKQAHLTANPSASSHQNSSDMHKSIVHGETFEAGKPIPLGMLLYYVAVNDVIVKLLTILIKVGITMLPLQMIRLKVRARLYVLVEYTSQFYRALVPITQWFLFLYESYSGIEVISGGLFSSLYLGAKVFELLERGKSLKKAIVTFRRNIDSERQPTKDELDAAGTVCPICHDSYTTPVILECGHIFCDECVSTWFKREQTCPMCRAKVSDDPTWQDGATTFFCQLF
ncbi:uncharacterized protein LOC115620502 [Scaptodrosophila lebanonensis]|uniref:Uncharacterized protein LOC115620502 n=1 Tax=Drosophila lebanonensis TaxID=7225 RepID=A0A6J2T314_DROLE|nr:uncharacterized protein LOC115620502 [Scaptodrosophila lebanonensis]